MTTDPYLTDNQEITILMGALGMAELMTLEDAEEFELRASYYETFFHTLVPVVVIKEQMPFRARVKFEERAAWLLRMLQNMIRDHEHKLSPRLSYTILPPFLTEEECEWIVTEGGLSHDGLYDKCLEYLEQVDPDHYGD